MNARLTFIRWFPQAALVTVIFFAVYVAAEQNLRMSANDPQIQIAEDAAIALAEGAAVRDTAERFGGVAVDIDSLNASGVSENLDILKSLRPFIIIFDKSGRALASSAILGDKVPVPPVGVFSYTAENNQDRFTWQPIPQLRLAAVMVKVQGGEAGFVLSARSLREVEMREKEILNSLALMWIIVLIASLGYSIFMSAKNGQPKKDD